ncbi:thiosulfate sulfurtransferase GlpE [Shewanella sp. NFH-SH190041]|uniref:thiosulfate sulfurtransferase GlpE n=1 Tax=Shewanella sp. NFH-SH190041 TaxID=2950245 RepID=UPI0021C28623|nr:thiosulfate sulfurtransferase GlpE [Shewanella sp. NFH-SH190041]BDM62755.1 thiosulfate sulfurtransferase GlpE [Shewanella sp. NFH-SH190041]
MTPYQHLSVAQLQAMQSDQQPLQIVDIRDPQSFAAGHIPAAFNLSNDNLTEYIHQADLDVPLVVVCYHGISSQQAAVFLHEQGFDQVYSLDGGFQGWQQATGQ